MTRSQSRDSTSTPSIARNTAASDSTPPSLTPATSNTDAASVSTDATPKAATSSRSSKRLQLVRSSIASYNENVLSGTAKHCRKRKAEGDERNVSDETLVNIGDSQQRFMQESMQILDRGWTLGAMPGENLKKSIEAERAVKKRQSMPLEILEKASDMVEKTKSVLGKRGRETIEAGMQKLQALKGDKRASLRPRGVEIPSLEGPSKKRARFSDVTDLVSKSMFAPADSDRKVARMPSTKRWLSQGLYVGQDPDFDPRLTETKNKAKKATARRLTARQRTMLPLPMFAGQRTIEMGRNFRLPFDVFSPLPAYQPKPEEWKKTHKNVFIGNAAAVWKKSKPLEASTCICKAENGCGDDCFNRFMFYECDDSNCNVGVELCTNRAFAGLKERTKAGGKYNVGVEVIKTADRGHGVRSNRTFEPNQIIVEYTGEIITQDECDDRMNKRYKNAECYYLMDFDQHMILDATRGSIARFINHSCEPNCKMIKWTVAGKPRMALFAGDRGIMTGEELTYDYNFNPYSIKNVQECRCGSTSCRGVLGPKPKETKEIKDALKPIANGGKRKMQQTLEDAVESVTETVVKRRKLASDIPLKVKKGYAYVKIVSEKASERLTKGKGLAPSSAENERLVRKASERSLRGMRRMTTSQITPKKAKRHITVTYSRRRSSTGAFVKQKDEKKEDNGEREEWEDEGPETPKIGKGRGTPNRKEVGKAGGSSVTKSPSSTKKNASSVKKTTGSARENTGSTRKNAGSVKKNVVRTLRRSSRGNGGKTIRVIEDEGKEE